MVDNFFFCVIVILKNDSLKIFHFSPLPSLLQNLESLIVIAIISKPIEMTELLDVECCFKANSRDFQGKIVKCQGPYEETIWL